MEKYLITDRSDKFRNKSNRVTCNNTCNNKVNDFYKKSDFEALISTRCWIVLVVVYFVCLMLWLLPVLDGSSFIADLAIADLALSISAFGTCIVLWLMCLKSGHSKSGLHSFKSQMSMSDSAKDNFLSSLIMYWFAVSFYISQFFSLQTSVFLITLVSLTLAILANKLADHPANLSRPPKHNRAGSQLRTLVRPAQNKLNERELNRRELNEIEKFISTMPMGVIQWNSKRQLVNFNCAAANILKLPIQSSSALHNIYIDKFIAEQQIVLIPHTEFDQLLYQTIPNNFEHQNIMRNAKVIYKWAELERYDRRGKVCGGMACFEDVTEQIKMTLKIKHHAYFDVLTGLPNRYRLAEEITRVLSTVQRTNFYCALLFIDLDRFKEVNDQWGHNHGDAVLKAFAHRLRKVIRTQETVARLGGDEFVAVVEGLGTCREKAKSYVAQVARKIIATTRTEFVIGTKVSQIGCSIGIRLFNDAQLGSKDLLDRADYALYSTKQRGRCNYTFDETTTSPNHPHTLADFLLQH